MRNRLLFLSGACIGFVLGARAGREQYERMRKAGDAVVKSPAVTEAVGTVRVQAVELAKRTKHSATDMINERMAERKEQEPVAAGSNPLDNGHKHHSRFVDHVPGRLGHHAHNGSR
jgi:hypothetical protein